MKRPSNFWWCKRRPPIEYGVFARAWLSTVTVRMLLPCLAVRTIRRVLRRVLSADAPLPGTKRLPADRVVSCATRAGRFSPLPVTCLVTAVVVEALLNQHGYPARLQVGVQRGSGGSFAAHAWVVLEDAVVVGGPVSVINEYTPLPHVERFLI